MTNYQEEKMNFNGEFFKDAVMILGGLSYYLAGAVYVFSKLTASVSLNLM